MAWISRWVLLLAVTLPGGCAVAPAVVSKPVLEQLAAYGRNDVRDLRGEFRAALCARMDAQPGRCADELTSIADDPPPVRPAPQRVDPPGAYEIAVVPGLFAECLPPEARPLADAAQRLREYGLVVHELLVPGRGGVAVNGEVLARQIDSLQPNGKPLIVIAYSKGLIDVLDALVQRPDLQERIAAVVGVSGAAYGSRLAGSLEALYRITVMRFPFSRCQPGDGSELLDLTPEAREQWWFQNEAALRVPRYSIVAVPQESRVSPLLSFNHRLLSRFDPLNDGQILWRDAVMGSAGLLGFVNADHWGVAMSMGKTYPVLSPWVVDELPRTAMLLAIIDVIATDQAYLDRQNPFPEP